MTQGLFWHTAAGCLLSTYGDTYAPGSDTLRCAPTC